MKENPGFTHRRQPSSRTCGTNPGCPGSRRHLHTQHRVFQSPRAPPPPRSLSPHPLRPLDRGSPFPAPRGNKCGRRGSSYPGLGPWRRPVPGARGARRGGSGRAGGGGRAALSRPAPRERPPRVPSSRQDARPARPPLHAAPGIARSTPRPLGRRPGSRVPPTPAPRPALRTPSAPL